MMSMLKLFRKLIKPKTKTTIPKPIVERIITVAKRNNISISPTFTKHTTNSGGQLKVINKDLISKINKLYKKQKKFGLSKRETTLLAEYTSQLEKVASTRDGTKRIFVED